MDEGASRLWLFLGVGTYGGFGTAGVVPAAQQLGCSSTECCCGLCRIRMEGSTVGGAQGSTQYVPMPSARAGGTAGSVVAVLHALVSKAFQ